jgi:hypothetical protein
MNCYQTAREILYVLLGGVTICGVTTYLANRQERKAREKEENKK